ncbi:MAG: DUF2344 domain-containing protein [Lachnospiraceae bacterium]|nr:DUF2344 domain-containing protein [Lachnospiraceae bacterium]
MKALIRFNKLGMMMYIGHLDLMRYFQKLFRRCGLDVSYSKGFNPHQNLSFASPLGLGLTSIGEYLDVQLDSLNYNGFDNSRLGESHTTDEWIEIINEHSNGLVNVTAFNILDDSAKPSMSRLSAATYKIQLYDDKAKDVISYFNEYDEIIYSKKTKKSTKEINLKENILVLSDNYDTFSAEREKIAKSDSYYEADYVKDDKNCLYIMCTAGSALNIKPEMLIESFESKKCLLDVKYDITRLDMYTGTDKFTSMSIVEKED